MKIPPELYGRLVEAIRAAAPRHAVLVHHASVAKEPRYLPGAEGNLPKRMRWDLFWAAFRQALERLAGPPLPNGLL